jgi:MutS domain V
MPVSANKAESDHIPGPSPTLSSSPPAENAGKRHAERRERFQREAEQLAVRSGRLSNWRLLAFFAALGLAGWALWTGVILWWAGSLLALAAFIGLVIQHRRVEAARRRRAGLAQLSAEAERRVARDWPALPIRHQVRAAPDHPYAADLDLFGRASLFQLLDTLGTWMGEHTLAGWLQAPADPVAIRERQAAVAELAPRLDFRDDLTWRARAGDRARPDPEPFLAWAEGRPWLRRQSASVWAARVSPTLLVLLAGAYFLGYLAYPVWVIALFVNLALAIRLVGPAVNTVRQVAAFTEELRSYAAALERIAVERFDDPLLRHLHDALDPAGTPAHRQLARLHRIALFGQPTSSILYVLLELGLLWNVHVLDALERWQAANGGRARAWLDALGQLEALAAVASLAHDNPTWAFPEIDPAANALAARALGHPLIPDNLRVANDVALGPPGSFLLVTGSNMSGKSTLLRAVGVNVALAQAGGPICASELRLPPLDLWTSMRVQDSLERGVSHFMAELERLKQVVDASECAATPGAPLLLYLLDEILQGTNTAERQVAARRIIRLLLTRPAIGAVSTHDLTLADAPDLAAPSRAVHLTETVSDGAAGPQMTFDYKLRPGIARSTNALRLMQLVGLPSDDSEPRA